MRLDWTDLQVFLSTCDTGSMTGAAGAVHLTVAAISARIRGLEEATGTQLLHRRARGVAPTPAGEALARHARLLVHELSQLQRIVRDAQDGAGPRLMLLANSAALAHGVASVAEDAAAQGGRIVVRESSSDAAVQALRCGAAQVAIVSDAVDLEGLDAHVLAGDPLVLVVPAVHPLAAAGDASFAEALQHPWIVGAEDSALHMHLSMHAARLGVRLAARVTYPRLDGVMELVGRGLGVSVLPDRLARLLGATHRVRRIRLRETWAYRRLMVCRDRRDTAPATLAAVESVRRRWSDLLA